MKKVLLIALAAVTTSLFAAPGGSGVFSPGLKQQTPRTSNAGHVSNSPYQPYPLIKTDMLNPNYNPAKTVSTEKIDDMWHVGAAPLPLLRLSPRVIDPNGPEQ